MKYIFIALLVISLSSCEDSVDVKDTEVEISKNINEDRYWYWYKSISLPGHGGTFITTNDYNIGDHIEDDGEIIEVTSEKHLLKK
jgi:hypothetical protein